MEIITPTKARENFYNILKEVNESHSPIVISGSKSNSEAVLISKEDWDSINETLYLENNGVLNVVRERMEDNSGWTDIDDINWDEL
ncbi:MULTISPECIES: type II toxin-antitoxin system Phd/YefM family antitoxin [Nosocomiicoccus]|uniref:Antitoxin n=1 Tax=Nosocomiicoccus massiliensis TaxID=1232430 RepID=A0AAF0YLE8_9STAP|nr:MULTISPECIES: type II toxin-antitoxin system Phd/YefM family antitoxin [Nosocomiicoccus]MDK6864014.1 type II toxin-antitoxin system Phd/YefM family antitoxin [Nosocomiicoccus ampullae]OFL48325.1 prevent-host-death protein [Nosocomiicoccus sp. HMSC067E10]OFO49440.1 prevent-host-death protein [Nosocomiicoccus sp. HMSC059G07]OFS63156.1 prevent-host-death protein [Nosocomiicoccus sp. HMSC09A07]WOS95879.1 type II toxin-antitoxin system Phd/YefM family antitoxin [Nosocomiicoccus massiliensis]